MRAFTDKRKPIWSHQRRGIHTIIRQGEVVAFKKCKFQATLVSIENKDDIEKATKEITADKKIRKATHPAMQAWKIGEE